MHAAEKCCLPVSLSRSVSSSPFPAVIDCLQSTCHNVPILSWEVAEAFQIARISFVDTGHHLGFTSLR